MGEPDDISIIGIIAIIMLCVLAGIAIILTTPASTLQEAHTAVFMNTSALDRNITSADYIMHIPFFIENHEGAKSTFSYSVDIHFKDTVLRKGTDTWTEDLNVDDQYEVVKGKVIVEDGQIGKVDLYVPVNSTQKWKNANVSIYIYKDGSPDIYRSLRAWVLYKE